MGYKLWIVFFFLCNLPVTSQEKDDIHQTPLNIEFSGGTVADLLSQIEKMTKVNPNVICTTEASTLTLPPFKVESVKLVDIMNALEPVVPLKVYVKQNIITLVTYRTSQNTPRVIGMDSPQKKHAQFNIEFVGGTLADLLLQIEKECQIAPNLIYTADASKVVLPSFKLHSVTLKDIVKALAHIDPALKISHDNEIITITWYETPQESRIEVYLLEQYLKKHKIEELVTAIQTAWEMESTEPAAKLKFHPDTKLLIALGREKELKIIQMVLSQLKLETSESPQETTNKTEEIKENTENKQ